MTNQTKQRKFVPIREGLLSTPLEPLDQVRLLGSKCKKCGEVAFGLTRSCPNCTSEEVEVIPLSKQGVLWTYTIIRNRPPGDYKGPDDPFVPFGEGLVELQEGIRVLSPLEIDIDKIRIGIKLELKVYKLYQNSEGNDVIAFTFKPIKES